jgi:hypothetical protein
MDIIKYMNSPCSFSRIVPAAGPLSPPAAPSAPTSFLRRPELHPHLPAPGDKPSGDWLFTEDDYLPFDADSFEER